MPRVVEVSAQRYTGWLERFTANNPDGPQRIVGVERFVPATVAILLVRRGGYAVGLAEGDRLVAHKCGTRYVQSRTAAGGWSQQRFARRRGNQADELVGAVSDHAVRILQPLLHRPSADEAACAPGLVIGGDKALIKQVLEDPRLTSLLALERREFFDIPDPRLAVLESVLQRTRSVRVLIEDTHA